jgi:hypothetical protein
MINILAQPRLAAHHRRSQRSHHTPICASKPNTTTSTTKSTNTIDALPKAAGALLLSATLFFTAPSAKAELNKFEYNAGGEFGNGTAEQYGEADIKGKKFDNMDLRRSNFTSADARDCSFKNSKLVGAYFIKTVLARADMQGADLSDVLMDRAVLVDANLKNTILARAVLTRSDLTGAKIQGADFTNALVDRTQQLALCRYAEGQNPVTGADTRKSLGCGSKRAFKASSPSNPDGPQVPEAEKDAFRSSMPAYRD